MPTVSIIMNCLNCSKYLREAIDSVYAQTYKDWEIILWGNASTDSSAEIAKSYDGRLRYFRSEETVPLGKARNLAIGQARGEYIAFLDCDDIWLPEKLEKQIPLFYRDRETAIVISNAIRFNEKGNNALFCKKKPKTGYVFRELLTNYFICLSTAVISRRVLDDLDEWFDFRFSHIEDAELFTRIAYTWHLDYVDAPLVKNRIHKESSTYQRPDLSPKETEMMISKFMGLYPDFEKLYFRELLKLRYYTQYYFALIDWRQGKNYLVRERLRPFLSIKFRAIIPFLLSFFHMFYTKLFTLYLINILERFHYHEELF